jgi:hypothetical protein
MAEAPRSAAEASTGIATIPAAAGALALPAGEPSVLVGVTYTISAKAPIPAATVRVATGAAPTSRVTVHATVGESAISVGAVRALVRSVRVSRSQAPGGGVSA